MKDMLRGKLFEDLAKQGAKTGGVSEFESREETALVSRTTPRWRRH